MEPGPRIDPDDHIPESVRGHGQREDSNAATSPSNGVPSAVAVAGGADAPSPSPPPAAPVDRPQERAREQGTHGSSSPSAAAGVVDRKGKAVAAVPSTARSPPRSAGTFEAGESSSAAIDSNKAEGQAKSSHAKKGRWSKLKNIFSRREKIVDREGRNIYSEHVDRQTIPITEIGTYYRATEDMPIRLNLDTFSRFRPVKGDGECFYRSFIFSYLEQVLDRQDTREEHRLLGILQRVSTQHTNLGWSFDEFPRCYKEMHNCLTIVACPHSFTHCWHELNFEVYCKVNNPILTTMNIKRNLLAKEQWDNITWKDRIVCLFRLNTNDVHMLLLMAFKKLIKKLMGWKRQGRWNSRASTNSYREEKLLEFFSNYETTEDILAFLRLVAAIRICSCEDEFIQSIPEINTNYSLKDWCFQYVIPSREFTDHVIMVALGTALEVPLRLEQLFGAGGAQDIYIGPGVVNVMLLYTGNHYDIIYPAESKEKDREVILNALVWTDKNPSAKQEDYDKKLKEVEAVLLPSRRRRRRPSSRPWYVWTRTRQPSRRTTTRSSRRWRPSFFLRCTRGLPD